MEMQTNKDGSFREVANIVIHVNDVKFRITEEDGGLKINKSDFNGNETINITPQGSNQIQIK